MQIHDNDIIHKHLSFTGYRARRGREPILKKKWKAETRVNRMLEELDADTVHPSTCHMPRIRFSEQYDSNDNGCAIHVVQHLLLLNNIRARIDHKAVWRAAETEGVIIGGGIPISDVHRCLDAKIHEMVRRRGMVFKSLNIHNNTSTRRELRRVLTRLRKRNIPFCFAYHGHAYCAYAFQSEATCVLNSASEARISTFRKGLWNSNRLLWVELASR